MRIKRAPPVLALHLKRFKMGDQQNRYMKLSYRVSFPFEMRLFNYVRSASLLAHAYAYALYCTLSTEFSSSLPASLHHWSVYIIVAVEGLNSQGTEYSRRVLCAIYGTVYSTVHPYVCLWLRLRLLAR